MGCQVLVREVPKLCIVMPTVKHPHTNEYVKIFTYFPIHTLNDMKQRRKRDTHTQRMREKENDIRLVACVK